MHTPVGIVDWHMDSGGMHRVISCVLRCDDLDVMGLSLPGGVMFAAVILQINR